MQLRSTATNQSRWAEIQIDRLPDLARNWFARRNCHGSSSGQVATATIPVECALDSGQFQAAVLTGCWAWRSSYCVGLR
jgi:hypothetical protein